jgi:hypothetical protein
MATYNYYSKGLSVTAGGGLTTFHTATATDIVMGLTVANTYSAPIQVSVQLVKAGATTFYLAYQTPIAVNDTLVVVGDGFKSILQSTDVVKVQVHTASGTADVVMAYQENT